MTRDEARYAWIASGLNYSHLTLGRLQKLRDMLNYEMKASGLMPTAARSGGNFRANARIFAGISSGGWCAALTCRAAHFKKREAITFSDSGFIGFAGWADDVNVQPVLKAFVSWLAWLEGQVPATVYDETELVWIQNLKGLVEHDLFRNDYRWKAIFIAGLNELNRQELAKPKSDRIDPWAISKRGE